MSVRVCVTSRALRSVDPSLQSDSSLFFSAVRATVSRDKHTFSPLKVARRYTPTHTHTYDTTQTRTTPHQTPYHAHTHPHTHSHTHTHTHAHTHTHTLLC